MEVESKGKGGKEGRVIVKNKTVMKTTVPSLKRHFFTQTFCKWEGDQGREQGRETRRMGVKNVLRCVRYMHQFSWRKVVIID